MEKKLPEFKPLPELGNVASNYMSAFNVGMNIYEALAYLQGYVQITYNSVDELIDDWNNFENYITENIYQITNEKTQELLNQWLSDGTLAETIKQSDVWNEKVSVTGDVMTGDLQFTEGHGLFGTSKAGNKINIASHETIGDDTYNQIGDENAQAVINSNERPIWHSSKKDQDLIVEDDLTEILTNIGTLQENSEKAVYVKDDVVSGFTEFTNYAGNTTYQLLGPSNVVNNLSSSSTNTPLSANQGRALNASISSLSTNITSLSNNFNEYKNLLGIRKIITGSITTSPQENPSGQLGYRNLWTYTQLNSMFDVSGLNNSSKYFFNFISNNNDISVTGCYRGSTYGLGVGLKCSLSVTAGTSVTLYYMGFLMN